MSRPNLLFDPWRKKNLKKKVLKLLVWIQFVAVIVVTAGLPDFSWYNIPKRGKYIPTYHKVYQIATKYTKWQ
jgi:hypothetical protein